jgi:hypothetical protein
MSPLHWPSFEQFKLRAGAYCRERALRVLDMEANPISPLEVEIIFHLSDGTTYAGVLDAGELYGGSDWAEDKH